MRLSRLAAIALFATEFLAVLAADAPKDLVVVDHTQRPKLEASDLTAVFKGAGFFLGEWDASAQKAAKDAGIEFRVILPDVTPSQRSTSSSCTTARSRRSPGGRLYRSGRKP